MIPEIIRIFLVAIWFISGICLFIATVIPPYSKRDLLILFQILWFGLAFMVLFVWFQQFGAEHFNLVVNGTPLPIYLVLAYWLWADFREFSHENETKYKMRPLSAIIHLPLLHWFWWVVCQAIAGNSC